MKVTRILNVVGALGTVPKTWVLGLEKLEIRERVVTIRTTALLTSARILKRVPEIWGGLLSLNLK